MQRLGARVLQKAPQVPPHPHTLLSSPSGVPWELLKVSCVQRACPAPTPHWELESALGLLSWPQPEAQCVPGPGGDAPTGAPSPRDSCRQHSQGATHQPQRCSPGAPVRAEAVQWRGGNRGMFQACTPCQCPHTWASSPLQPQRGSSCPGSSGPPQGHLKAASFRSMGPAATGSSSLCYCHPIPSAQTEMGGGTWPTGALTAWPCMPGGCRGPWRPCHNLSKPRVPTQPLLSTNEGGTRG